MAASSPSASPRAPTRPSAGTHRTSTSISRSSEESAAASVPGELRARIRGEEPEGWRRRHAFNQADQVRLDIADGARFAAANPAFLRTRAVEFVDLVSPLSFLVRQLRLVDDVGEPLESGAVRWWLSLFAVISWPLLALLAVQGWARVRDAAPLQSFASLTILCTSSVILLHGLTRLRLPMVPILMVLAAVALSGAGHGTSACVAPRCRVLCRGGPGPRLDPLPGAHRPLALAALVRGSGGTGR